MQKTFVKTFQHRVILQKIFNTFAFEVKMRKKQLSVSISD